MRVTSVPTTTAWTLAHLGEVCYNLLDLICKYLVDMY
nr:MAG TPA: hypothetical protein [Inoviridae sp.]